MYETNPDGSALESHIQHDAPRWDAVTSDLSHIKEKLHKLSTQGTKEMNPLTVLTSPAAPQYIPTGSNDGALGMGGGLIGGVVLGALLGGNRGGLFGGSANGAVEGVVTPTMLTSGLTGVIDTLQNTTIQQTLGDIKASIPLAEGQVQLALAVAQADVNGNISTGLTTAMAGQAVINKNISDAIAASLASQNNLNQNISAQGTMNLIATKDAQYAIASAIVNDGDRTRALITSIDKTNDSRLITAQANEISDLRAAQARAADAHGIAITMNNNQSQNQMQFQQQAQALNTVAHCLSETSQLARATNQQLIIGNSGTTSGGPQAANPVNVRT